MTASAKLLAFVLSALGLGSAQDPPGSPPVPEGKVLVTGIVRNHLDGAPLPGIHLTMRDPTAGCDAPATQTTVSDGEGRFRFLPFEPGPRFIVTSTRPDPVTKKPPFPPTETDLFPEEPGRLEIELVVGELGSVAGTVVDEVSGAPLRGARIGIRGADKPPVTSGIGGEFRVSDLALRNHSQQIQVEAHGYADFWGALLLGEKSVEGMTIRMRRARSIFGTVRNESEEPVGRVPGPDGEPVPIVVDMQGRGRIPFVHPDGALDVRESSPGRVDVRGVETDERGAWRIEGLDPDFLWSLALRGLPYRKDEVATFTFGSREYSKSATLTLAISARVEGRVLDEVGEPIVQGGVLATAASLVNEVFEEPLILLEKQEGRDVARWAPDAADRIASFPERISSSVRMRETHLARIGSEGHFQFPSVERGPTLFFVRRSGYAPKAILRDVGAEEAPWEVRLFEGKGVSVKGRVLDAEGQARAGVPVRALGVSGGEGELGWTLSQTTTVAEGAFFLRFDAAGPWRIVAGDSEATVESEIFEEAAEEEITLRPR